MKLHEVNQERASERLYWRTLINALSGSRRSMHFFWKKKTIGLDLYALHADPGALNPDTREEYLQVFRVRDDTNIFDVTLSMKANEMPHTVRFETRDVYSSESDWNEFTEKHMNDRAARGIALDIESDIVSWAERLRPQQYRKGNTYVDD